VNKASDQLVCLVMTTNSSRQAQIGEWLRFGCRVERVDNVYDAVAMRHQLAARAYDMTVIVSGDKDQTLPPCLLRYPDMRVLVLTTTRKIGPLPEWLHQGATEVVSLQKLPAVHHTISRLLDECLMMRKVQALCEQTDEQRQIIDALLSKHPHGIGLWQNGQVKRLNNQFDQSTGLMINPDGLINENAWLDWMSVANRYPLGELTLNLSEEPTMTSSTTGEPAGQLLMQRVRHRGKAARLLQVSARPKLTKNIPELATDSVTGLLARDSVLQGFQRLLHSGRQTKRYTAMLVQLLTSDEASRTTAVSRTLQDLTIYRAAEMLQQNFVGNTLLGRVSHDALLLIRPSTAVDASRLAANRVREVLGSLGGLLDAPNELRINTLNLAATSLSAAEVISRLERR
jgi:GGDEF domain-containing protein